MARSNNDPQEERTTLGRAGRSNAVSAAAVLIHPRKGFYQVNLRELWAYRDLLMLLTLRDIKVVYKQTVLGIGWAVIRPVVAMLVFTVVFGKIAKIASDGIPYALFNFVGLVPWIYFSSTLSTATSSLVQNSGMLTKVYFPRLVLPLAAVLAKVPDFLIAMAVTGVLMAYYGVAPGYGLLLFPVLVAVLVATTAGLGLWLSAMAVQYRDVRHAVPFVLQVMLYGAPVVWPVSALTERFGETARLVYGLYPLAGVIEGLRASLLGSTATPWDLIGLGAATALVLLVTGAIYFTRAEAVFADVA